MSQFVYANGMTVQACKKWCKFTFGNFLHKVKVNENDRMFDIIVYEWIEEDDGEGEREKKYFKDTYSKEYRDYFNEFWGTVPGFKIKVITVQQVEMD